MTTAPPQGKVDFSQFTTERYSAIVKWKTAFYSFYLPVALAMHMVGLSLIVLVLFIFPFYERWRRALNESEFYWSFVMRISIEK